MEGNETMQDFEMLEVEKGNEEDGFVAITLAVPSKKLESMKIVVKDAFTILAKAKNSEEEGGGHGH
jgi:cobalt-zinc-cadmium efflux system membrane fusion protein